MDIKSLQTALADLPISDVRYFPSVGSTNSIAAEWAAQGANDLSLVIANEQTAGRGRANRRWFTPPNAALAFSLIIHPKLQQDNLERWLALGSLAVCLGLAEIAGLYAHIKWPNDVLLERRKVAGVLAEAFWLGNQLEAIVIGIGVNIKPSAVPPLEMLNFPATCIESVAGHSISRSSLLHAILSALITWRSHVHTQDFLDAWNSRLAFRDEWVQVTSKGSESITGQLLNLNSRGELLLRTVSGEVVSIQAGEVHLRPVDSSKN
ncbi:MAG: biotin--[acetyl-CoA-carboxylase] ligase [Chloroflexota bacterium]